MTKIMNGGSNGLSLSDSISQKIQTSGVTFNMANLMKYFTMMGPFLLTFFMIMLSIFNSNPKGFIYLLGVGILLIIISLFQNVIKYDPKNYGPVSAICKVFAFPDPFGLYSIPQFSSSLYAFTFIYLIAPMIQNSIFNIPFLVTLLVIGTVDAIVKTNSNFTTGLGIVLGAVFGIFWGFLYYSILNLYGSSQLLYYDDYLSNKVACSRPEKQKFKCSVYKNGELINTI